MKLESSPFYISAILLTVPFTYLHIMSTHRKSVAFSDEHTIVASNGEVTEVNGTGTPDKTSAESHSVGESAWGTVILTAY